MTAYCNTIKEQRAAGCSENQGRVTTISRSLFPVPCGALTVIGVSTLPQGKGGKVYVRRPKIKQQKIKSILGGI